MSEISDSDYPLPRAGNRFDTLDGGVLYASTEPLTCYWETLARFRPTAAVRAAVKDEDPGFMVCGGVPADWRARRVKVCLTLEDPLPFLDVEHPATHEYLTTQIASQLAALGVPLLDVAAVRGPDRLVTRTIATWAFRAGLHDDSGGNRFHYAGIRYLSRFGPYECWAVFQGTPVRELSRDTISLSDTDLRAAADKFELRLF